MKIILIPTLFLSVSTYSNEFLKESPHKTKAKIIYSTLVEGTLAALEDNRAILCKEGKVLQACRSFSEEILVKNVKDRKNIEALVTELESLNYILRDYYLEEAALHLASAAISLGEASYFLNNQSDYQQVNMILVKSQKSLFCNLYGILPKSWLENKDVIKTKVKLVCER